MKLHGSRITPIAAEIVRELLAAKDIEAASPREVQLDIEAVLKSYLEAERAVNEKTKDLLQRTNRAQSEYGRVRVQVAESQGIKVGDDALDYVLDQLIEAFHHSAHVEEIFPEDVVLRRKMIAVFRKLAGDDDGVDAEVRGQLKHVQEGSRTWDVEYARVAEQVRRKRGLS